ncbi:MAG TPA: glutaredoxin domain-containing protein [Leptospiraceae bacterium]|nr:glutaredoxin domain-containing protein [Leptospiraceae bacterium]HMY65214.1 glutaredoxin domain-containing protein [Leptospiraceae bacterium]HNF13321.1 glutaredoxin domain-containing protein [Leptospiraceae bacterium]HNI94748.1 glutaredoxin domain-containing protein [Leptospiraceae bacterium]HNM04249.1 glutaredoxin domain-containing protein [Leptospiraceae bacterium]
MYRTNECGFCNAMRKSLNKDRIHFTFYNVNSNNAKISEMREKVRTVNPKAASTKFPVMNINGKIMIRPTYKQVKALVSKT